jgi:hypothetical protein
MPLTLVSEVMMHGGYLPQLAELDKAQTSIWTRKNGVMFSIFWFIFWVPLMAAVFGGVFNVEILGELCALLGVMGSALIFIFSLAYLKGKPKYNVPGQYPQQQVPNAMYGHQAAALPPQQSMPAQSYVQPGAGSWRDTNDLEPHSVTEGTTKLLEKEEQPPQ